MTDYFTADLHFGHEKVATIRGFDSTDEHDARIVENIVATVKRSDRLFVLGDLSVGRGRGEDRALDILRGIDVEKHLIAGNHDSCHPLHSGAFRTQREFLKVFESVQSQQAIKIAGQRAALSHYPYSGDHTAVDRDVRWRLRDCGDVVIHGHTHAGEPVSRSQSGTLQLCVSVDAWGLAPVSKDLLSGLIEKNSVS